MSSRISQIVRSHRLLVWLYVPAILVAVWEKTGDIHPDSQSTDRDSALAAYAYLIEYEYLFQELYPDHPRSGLYRGLDALHGRGSPEEARRCFEAAIATGVKTDEGLLYNYAKTLILLDENPAQVDAAVANWKANFPTSKIPDPRTDPEVLALVARRRETRGYAPLGKSP